MPELIAGEDIKRGQLVIVRENGLAYGADPESGIGAWYAKGHHSNGLNLNCIFCGLTWEQYRDQEPQLPCTGKK